MPIPQQAKSASTRLVCFTAAGIAAAALTACDAQPSPSATTDSTARQVTVVGAGEVQGAPDTLTVDASIESLAPDATAAMAQTNDLQQAVIGALVAAGIDREDLATTQADLQPQYAPENNAITGYRATNTIDVTIRDLDLASEAIGLIVGTGGNAARINSISYSIDDDSQLLRDARARAFEDAKDRANQYAELAGLDLGTVISISETGGAQPPQPMPAARGMVEAAVPLEPGQQTVSFTVTAVWELT